MTKSFKIQEKTTKNKSNLGKKSKSLYVFLPQKLAKKYGFCKGDDSE